MSVTVFGLDEKVVVLTKQNKKSEKQFVCSLLLVLKCQRHNFTRFGAVIAPHESMFVFLIVNGTPKELRFASPTEIVFNLLINNQKNE